MIPEKGWGKIWIRNEPCVCVWTDGRLYLYLCIGIFVYFQSTRKNWIRNEPSVCVVWPDGRLYLCIVFVHLFIKCISVFVYFKTRKNWIRNEPSVCVVAWRSVVGRNAASHQFEQPIWSWNKNSCFIYFLGNLYWICRNILLSWNMTCFKQMQVQVMQLQSVLYLLYLYNFAPFVFKSLYNF